jgi:hypothetical protein
MARVIISGLSGLKKKLNQLSVNVQKEVIYQVQDSGTAIQMGATAAAPAGLVGRIDNVAKNNGFAAEIGVQSETRIPVYVEFGTGESAAAYVPTLPKEIQDYARQFYENGQGRMMKRPYLIPAFLRESPIFIKELEKILKKNV